VLVALAAVAVGIGGAASLARAVRQAPARRHFQAGLAAVEAGRPQVAEGEWREAVRLAPEYLPPYRLLAGLYLSTGLWRKGHEILGQLRAVAPREPHLECQTAEAAFHLGLLPAAEEHARAEVARDPACGRGRLLLGRLMIRRKNEREAVTHLREAVRRMPEAVEPRLDLAQAYIENMRLTEAQALLLPLAAGRPELGHAQYMLGFCYARNAAEPDGPRKAEEALRRALATDPEDEGALCELGRLYLLLGRSGEALPLLRAAARLAPSYPPVFHHLARACRAARRPDEARRAEARYLALNRLAAEQSTLIQRHGILPADPAVRRRLAELDAALGEKRTTD
jgi:predicted Zn-dependent protease